MERHRAILVSTISQSPLSPDWSPMINQQELEYANQRLQVLELPYQWHWLGKLSTLSGSVNLNALSVNAAAQLSPAGHRS